jgi:hypothetical protein
LLRVAAIVEANQAEIAFPTSTLHIEGQAGLPVAGPFSGVEMDAKT